MKISRNGVELIRGHESCCLVAYQDVRGRWTIGWGHTGPDVGAGVKWSQQQADATFALDLKWVEDTINELVKVPLTQDQFDALADFIYNVGRSAFAQSTLLRKLNARDYAGARLQFRRWNKATVDGKLVPVAGLTKRRSVEAAMFAK